MKKNLNKLRDDIDKIDTKLLDLISERAFIAQEVGKLKNDGVIYRPEREAQVLLRLLRDNPNLRNQLGSFGRARVEQFYSLRSNLPLLARTIRDLAI